MPATSGSWLVSYQPFSVNSKFKVYLKQLDECLFLFYIDKIELKSSNYKWSIIIHFWNLTTPNVIGTENWSNFEIEVSVATYAQTHAWSLHVWSI